MKLGIGVCNVCSISRCRFMRLNIHRFYVICHFVQIRISCCIFMAKE